VEPVTYQPLDHIIIRTEVGSTAYGTGLPGHEDLDHMAVCVETREQTIGLEHFEHYIHRPGRGPADPSGPGDLDLTVYSLRKWARLALKGNPSVLMLLFGPTVEVDPLARPLLDLRGVFATRHAKNAFLGYMTQQRQRMTGERGAAGRIRRNPGTDGQVDWKYAMHMVRLGYQGYIYCLTGRIDVPIPEPMRSVLIDIRHGRLAFDDVIGEARHWEERLSSVDLPAEPPFALVQSVVMDIYRAYWQRQDEAA
jgi:uncharacterized protein